MLRRVKLIPFKAKFKENPDAIKGEQKINKYLVKQLSETYINQVLKFMVLGAIEFIKDSDMTPPAILLKDMDAYLKEINPAESFIQDKFIITDDDKDKIKKGEMYDIYKKWAIDNGLTIFVKKSDFYKTIDLQLGEAKLNRGIYYYKNIVEIDEHEGNEDSNDHTSDV